MEMPLVSVCMTTYNHEPYIAEAIESVLAQQTSFGVELVVGEDCSTDRTAAICREYAAKYPDRIRLVTSPENVGWRANYRRTFEACRGKYVAYCDGDDWWSDPRKLQMQADLLGLILRPQDTRCVQKLQLFAQTDPLFSLRDARFVSGIRTGSARIRIDKCRFPDGRNTDNHRADRTVQDAAFAVALDFLFAGLLYGAVDRFHAGSGTGINLHNRISLSLEIFHPGIQHDIRTALHFSDGLHGRMDQDRLFSGESCVL